MTDLSDHPELLPLLARVQDDEAREMLTEILAMLFAQRDRLHDELRAARSKLQDLGFAEKMGFDPPLTTDVAIYFAAFEASRN